LGIDWTTCGADAAGAKELLQKVADSDSKFHLRALNDLAVILEREGETDAAISLYRRSILGASEDASQAAWNLGKLLCAKGDLAEARYAFDAVDRSDKRFRDVDPDLYIEKWREYARDQMKLLPSLARTLTMLSQI
jgi:Flp pilus assembly protein TadD